MYDVVANHKATLESIDTNVLGVGGGKKGGSFLHQSQVTFEKLCSEDIKIVSSFKRATDKQVYVQESCAFTGCSTSPPAGLGNTDPLLCVGCSNLFSSHSALHRSRL